MKLTKKTIKLLCELEYIIGDECYNPNSVNGYTLEEGCSFRYPITYNNKDDKEEKTRWKINDMDAKRINSMRYKFGSNNLYIGSALVKVLNKLEEEYGIDFDKKK
ncbi:MAG: hypothetical protein IKQ72_06185 [Bacteroidaceae bacterium]|nr:hypothetical protein [Bacteroidaceae bacterium]